MKVQLAANHGPMGLTLPNRSNVRFPSAPPKQKQKLHTAARMKPSRQRRSRLRVKNSPSRRRRVGCTDAWRKPKENWCAPGAEFPLAPILQVNIASARRVPQNRGKAFATAMNLGQ